MATREINRYGKKFVAEIQESPIFQFKCPRCEEIVYEGVVDFDLERDETCPHCNWSHEIWMFPHTILGSKLWTIGGHYSNDAMTSLPFDDVIHYFLWLIADDQQMVHGCAPYHLGTYEECVEKLKGAHLLGR